YKRFIYPAENIFKGHVAKCTNTRVIKEKRIKPNRLHLLSPMFWVIRADCVCVCVCVCVCALLFSLAYNACLCLRIVSYVLGHKGCLCVCVCVCVLTYALGHKD